MNGNKKSSVSDYCTQTFAIVDQWLNQVSLEKGQEALGIVKTALQNNWRTNITYYEQLAEAADSEKQSKLAKKYRLLARCYNELVWS